MERVGVVGPEPRLLWTDLKALDRMGWSRIVAMRVYKLWTWHSSAKTREKESVGEGFARGRSDA